MKAGFALTGLLLALTAPVGLAASAAAAPPPVPGAVEVELDQSRLNTVVGERLTVSSRVINSGDAPTDRLVAHLNVASLDGIYVDLEDWSADVTREVPPVAPGSSTSLSWQFQAVNTGSFDVYVVLMPNGDSTAGTGPLVASQPVHVTVAGKRTLTAAGSLPVALLVPVVLGLVAAAARYRVRRTG
ncbi:hypothetical protein [Micromonospora inositola]|uniref:Uncharacterized protein n=1 Tax=Micromonospora inositola TaxID=47865 RepID=A0A1C5J7U1_9ACTN|nr:hypothetical protein [Micromonospora inositola]SCG66625.1 hypothetical protein GA0070613_4183 [Micromonospora inositola]